MPKIPAEAPTRGIYEADSIKVSLAPACGGISESVFLSAFWDRPCTPVAIAEPADQWVMNRYDNEMLIKEEVLYNPS